MAKGNKGGKGSEGKGKMTVVMFQLEGSDETIQEGFRVFGEALDKIAPAVPAYRSFSSAVPHNPQLIETRDGQVESHSDTQLEDEFQQADSPKPDRVRSSNRKIPAMTLVKDLNLRPQGEKSFRDFYNEKNPDNNREKIAVCVYYLAKILSLQGITPHHVYTCFKDVGARTPRDFPQAIRETASRKAWVDSSTGDNITITNHGENFVEHDLPKNSAPVSE